MDILLTIARYIIATKKHGEHLCKARQYYAEASGILVEEGKEMKLLSSPSG
jgi:hypothetical protein